MNFSKVAVIGLGLIGGSLAYALKKTGLVGEVFGVDVNERTVDYAIREGIIHSGSINLEDGVRGSEVVVIATYVGIIPAVARSVAGLTTSSGAIITDVGSVKGSILGEIDGFLPSHLCFVGAHPIAGTERSGVWASDSGLFRDRRCILTPTPKTNLEALDKVKALWESVGSEVFFMDAQVHDRVFALVSHLPHVVAYALVNSVAQVKEPADILDFAGGGLRDYTRIAASSPQMWSGIFLGNREQTLQAIGEFTEALERIRRAVEKDDLESLMKELEYSRSIKKSLHKSD